MEAQISSAPGPSRAARRSFSSPAALLVKVMARMDQGTAGSRRHSRSCPFPVPLPRGGVSLQKGQVVPGHPLGDLRTVGAPAIFHQVGDAVDEHGGLTAPRPGQQKQRPLGGQHRTLLLRVQPGKLPGDGRPARLTKSKFLFVVQHGISHSFIQCGIVPLYPKRGLRSTAAPSGPAHGQSDAPPLFLHIHHPDSDHISHGQQLGGVLHPGGAGRLM